jgi:maltose alpha-D-glucosyltransferase/alpha-amylase
VWNLRFDALLLEAIGQGRRFSAAAGVVVASATSVFPQLRGDASHQLAPHVLGVEQSNTNIRYGEHLLMKLYRRLEAGTNPDLEIGQFLTEQADFAHIPPVAGAIEYRSAGAISGEPITLAILQGFVRNQGDAWYYTLDSLREYFGGALASKRAPEPADLPAASLLEAIEHPLSAHAEQRIGAYVQSARLLGQRTGELHVALASTAAGPGFAPEPFTNDFQHALQQSMCGLNGRIMQLLRGRFDSLPGSARPDALAVLDQEMEIARRFDTLLGPALSGLRTRIHGDYHLGQVLYTGSDFMIIDFEGEPARPLAERRQKRSALQDVAGMLRSFHYAAYSAYFEQLGLGAQSGDVEPWAQYWHRWVSVAFLQSYLAIARHAAFLPQSDAELKILLDAYLLEKAVYELGYELNNRPDWVRIPLQGILQTLQEGQ